MLDLSALLTGVNPGDDGDELDDYLSFSFDGTDTTITIDAQGDGSGTDTTVVLQNIDLTSNNTMSDEDIINGLLANNLTVV